MARINISVPNDLYDLSLKWRNRVNLSEICSRSLQVELEALEHRRNLSQLFSALRPPTETEKALALRFNLAEAVVIDKGSNESDLRESLGLHAASYLSRYLCDDSLLAIGGGRQMWCIVRNMTPRQVRVTITALGIRQNDPQVLHAHPNTLTTLLWLLFSPHAEARLIASGDLKKIWEAHLPQANHPKYFVIGSCGPFNFAHPFAELLGPEISRALIAKRVSGDFLYQFFDDEGGPLSFEYENDKSILDGSYLVNLSKRPDARVIMVAGGSDKLKILRVVLKAGLCNVLITDLETARQLSGN